jgi:hypothetical protein
MALVDRIAQRLEDNVWEELSWSDFVSSVGNASVDDKTLLLEAVQTRSENAISRVLLQLVIKTVRETALAEAQTYIDDGSIPLNKLGRFL